VTYAESDVENGETALDDNQAIYPFDYNEDEPITRTRSPSSHF